MTKQEFLKKTGLTEEQFSGKEMYQGSLDLRSLTSIPEGFNPTVGNYLDLRSLTSIPEGFKKADFEQKEIPLMEWKKGGKHFILADGVFSEVVKKKGNIWYLKSVGKSECSYLVTDGNGKYAHGDSIKSAKEDLIYKISNRDKSVYKSIDIKVKNDFSDCIEMYRVITGACATGVRGFIESKGIKKAKYSVLEIIQVTKGAYGSKEFASFFWEITNQKP